MRKSDATRGDIWRAHVCGREFFEPHMIQNGNKKFFPKKKHWIEKRIEKKNQEI